MTMLKRFVRFILSYRLKPAHQRRVQVYENRAIKMRREKMDEKKSKKSAEPKAKPTKVCGVLLLKIVTLF
jgi:hypothetical protein